MVKTKQQKSKHKKQPHIKKHGKQADISEFRAQLDAFGLKFVQVTADGNCFFRALADQLEGNEEEHEKYRSMVVHFILKNREMFEPFIEDEVPFDEYCQSMEKDGTWAGHMELQAASLATDSNICIHRSMSPRWYIWNFEDRDARMIHLSYHDGEHYNSVRLKEDTCTGPARPIIIKADTDLSATSHQAKVAVTKSKGGAGNNFIPSESIKLVMAGTGCENAKKVEEVLLQVGGDADAAIEFLIAEHGTEEVLAESDKLPCLAYASHDLAPIDINGAFGERGSVLHKSNYFQRIIIPTNVTLVLALVREKPLGTRFVHVVRRRNTRLVVGHLQGDLPLNFSPTKLLTMARVEKKENKARKVDQPMLQIPKDLKEAHLIWVHFVSEHHSERWCTLLLLKERSIPGATERMLYHSTFSNIST